MLIVDHALSRDKTLPATPFLNHNLDNPRSGIDQMLAWVINYGLSDREIGYAVRRLAEIGNR